MAATGCINADHLVFLLQLSELELIERERKAAERRLKAARFPAAKLLDEFDFLARPSINKPLILELLQGEYLDRRENILLVGPSGTGKTHLATALGMVQTPFGATNSVRLSAELAALSYDASVDGGSTHRPNPRFGGILLEGAIMAGIKDFLIDHVFMNISQVRAAATNHNGACTWQFSQSVDPVRSLIGRSSETSHGICEILAAKWICEETCNNTLSQWLTTPTGGLDIAKLSLLAQIFGTGSGTSQKEKTEAWMRTNGVPPRNNGRRDLVDMGGAPTTSIKFDPDDDLLGDFDGKASNAQIAKPLYALIFISEQNRIIGHKGHVMALKAEAATAATFKYFDPNFGEFRFNNWNGFRLWFVEYFRKSHYQKFLGTYYHIRYF